MAGTFNRPNPLNVPDQPSRSNPSTFADKAELAIKFQFEDMPEYMEDMANYIEEQADIVEAGLDPSQMTTGSLVDRGASAALIASNAVGDGIELVHPSDVAEFVSLGDLADVSKGRGSKGNYLQFDGIQWRPRNMACRSAKHTHPEIYTSSSSAPGSALNSSSSTFYTIKYPDISLYVAPSMANSSLMIDALISHAQHHDAMWFMTITVDGVTRELGSGAPHGNRNYGHAPIVYNQQHESSMCQSVIKWDFPVTSTSVHIIEFYIRQANNNSLRVNQGWSDTDSESSERGVSYARVQEVPFISEDGVDPA